MLALTSLLEDRYSDLVNQIILDFEKEFGLRQVQETPFPHITYLTTKAINLPLLKHYLERFSSCAQSFHVYTTGIGVFPGERPVIYIPVLRTQPLNKFHSQLYHDISKLSIELGPFSKPKMWLPHITLAVGDTANELMTPIFQYLARYNFDWEIKIDNLCIFRRSEDDNYFEKEGEFVLSRKILS